MARLYSQKGLSANQVNGGSTFSKLGEGRRLTFSAFCSDWAVEARGSPNRWGDNEWEFLGSVSGSLQNTEDEGDFLTFLVFPDHGAQFSSCHQQEKGRIRTNDRFPVSSLQESFLKVTVMLPCHCPEPNCSVAEQGELGNIVFTPDGLKPFIIAPKNQEFITKEEGKMYTVKSFLPHCLYNILQILTPVIPALINAEKFVVPLQKETHCLRVGCLPLVLLALHFSYSLTYFLTESSIPCFSLTFW